MVIKEKVFASFEEVKALYLAADSFCEKTPWDYLSENELFAVHHPDTGEVGYCSITGELYDFFSLTVYLGSEGLEGLKQLQQQADIQDPFGLHPMELKNCLVVSFEEKSTLKKEELLLLNTMNHHPKGKKAWPSFYRCVPSAPIRKLNRQEVQFLTIILEQATHLIMQYQLNPKLFFRPSSTEQYLTRVLSGCVWETHWKTPPPHKKEEWKPYINTTQLHQLKKAQFKRRKTWLFDFHLCPNSSSKEQLLYTAALMTKDRSLVQTKIITFPTKEIGAFLLNTFQEHRLLPKQLVVGSVRAHDFVLPLANRLNIPLLHEESPEPLVAFFSLLDEHLRHS